MNSSTSNLGSPRPSRKACISPTFVLSKYSDNHPEGKYKGAFSNNSASTYSYTSRDYTSSKSSRKHFGHKRPSNPILQPQSFEGFGSGMRIVSGAPSVITKYSSERKYNLPSQMGIGNRFEQTYSSQVFKETDACYLFNGKTKTLLSKTGQIPSLIQYDFALPYKEQKITPKIGYE